MKLIKLSALFILTLLISVQFASAKDFVDGELLVKFKTGTISAEAFTANSMIGAEVLENLPLIGWQRVKLPDGMSLAAGESYYQKLSAVEYVQPNFYYHLLVTPNDPQFTSTGMYGLTKIAAPQAWDLTTGNSAVVVADIDTGMRYTHQDLAANAWINPGEIAGNGVDDDGNGFVDDVNGWDFFFNDSNPIDDAGGHGTHTAGTIGARGNNALNVTGVNWNVKLMPIKIYSPNGTDTTSTMLVNAYNYITMMKNRGVNIRVTNNSYGGCNEACGYDQATKDALDAMGNAGILNVFAAGNSNTNNDTTPSYPVSYTSPSVLGVASSTSTDAKSSFSSFGLVTVDLAAPGSSILSTFNSSNTSTATLSGTSMATPHVTGAAALLSGFNQNLSVASLKATLLNNVDVLANWNGLTKTGGRLNVFKALQNQTVCTFTTTDNFSVNASGTSIVSDVLSPTNCDYSVTSNVNWITINAGNPGSGNMAFSFTVQPNTGAPRSGTIKAGDQTVTINQSGVSVQIANKVLDFDGDGKTDYVAIQNNGGGMTWHISRSAAGYTAVNFGFFGSDVAVPMDYDGDGKTDVAVWRGGSPGAQGYFYYVNSSNGAVGIAAWGSGGDNPTMTQDFDGDGKADLTVVRNVNGTLVWYVSGSTAGLQIYQFGSAGDLPIRGDFDGDAKADPSVYRTAAGAPANTFFSLLSTTANLRATNFGTSATDKIVPGDFDGDGKTNVAVWRNTDGNWYFLRSSNGAFSVFSFGIGGTDLPTPGDYDGDGKTDFSVWRPNSTPSASGAFYIFTQQSAFSSFGWGNSDMIIPANTLQVRN